MFQRNEIWLTYAQQSSAVQAAGAGLPVRWVEPKEGSVATSHIIGVPENAPNAEDAQWLVNLLPSPEFQRVMTETDFQAPVPG